MLPGFDSRRCVFGLILSLGLLQWVAHGQVWTALNAPNTNWLGVASSATGTNLFAVARPTPEGNDSVSGVIYSSNDAGISWHPSGAPVSKWKSITCSGDGTVVV